MRLIGREIVVPAVLCLMASAALEVQEPMAKIVEFGRYKATGVELTPAKDTSGNVIVQLKHVTHLETTKKIHGKVGEVFGFRLQFKDLPKGQDYTVRTETHHPPIKQPGGEVLTKSVEEVKFKAGADPSGFSGWFFLKGFEYEIVPGTWTRKVFVDGKEIVSMTFEVEKK